MKKWMFIAIIACTGILQTAEAQRRSGKAQKTPTEMTKQLDKKLNLSEEQEKQITALYTDFFKQNYPREERRQKMSELQEKIKQLLTDEQKTKFENLKQKRSK